MKQWGVKPEDLDPAVTGRVPVYVSRDDRYFQNRWQGIPQDGYTPMLERMLDHENITVKLGTSWNDVKEECRDWRIFYTGPVDELMGWQFGDLPYRSIELDFREYDREFFQPSSVVNYPENYDFTRIGEYKYFLDDKSPKTVVSFEYPSAYQRGENEPYYPIASDENAALYQKYLEAARAEYKDIHFLGRLGDYKYYDMDKAIARALELVESL
jgi:UDP-galactopyranose mutase